MGKSSRISGFHKMSLEERITILREFADLTDEDVSLLGKSSVLGMETAERMIENVIGTFELPLGLVTNMTVNGRDVLIPIAVEESSVVAAMANAGKMARSGGGFLHPPAVRS
jgi:hydroxymethylglutaryl-CoA reductase